MTKSPFDSYNAESAIRFCESALKQGYKITQVFFYQAGVHNASFLQQPNSDEFSVYEAWLKLNKRYGLRLNVCSTAAARRGIVNNELAIDGHFNVQAPFEQVGLSDYFANLSNDTTINLQF